MSTPRISWMAVAASLVLVAMTAPPAVAQEAAAKNPAADQGQQGPLVFQPVQSGWVMAPEVKATEFSDHYGTMVGAYVGWLTDESFLIGGSAYWLVDGAPDRGLAYGGLLLGWYAPIGRVARFGARGLVGAGSGTTGLTLTSPPWDGRPCCHTWDKPPADTSEPVTWRGAYSTHFLIAEPEASFVVRLSDWMSINASVGYRFVGWANGFEDRFRGPTGSIGIRFGSQ